jgi:hypothetical protein
VYFVLFHNVYFEKNTLKEEKMADITLVNMNMLYIKYLDGEVRRQNHVTLGPLYLISALREKNIQVDFRDYQMLEDGELFDPETARKAGYLDQVVDAGDLLSTAQAHAEAIKPLSGSSLTGNKLLLRETTLANIAASLPA